MPAPLRFGATSKSYRAALTGALAPDCTVLRTGSPSRPGCPLVPCELADRQPLMPRTWWLKTGLGFWTSGFAQRPLTELPGPLRASPTIGGPINWKTVPGISAVLAQPKGRPSNSLSACIGPPFGTSNIALLDLPEESPSSPGDPALGSGAHAPQPPRGAGTGPAPEKAAHRVAASRRRN